MNINCKVKMGTCILKTKTATITIDDKIKVNELVLPGPGEYEVAQSLMEVGEGFVHVHADDLDLAFFDETRDSVTESELQLLENVDAVMIRVKDADKDKLTKIAKMITTIDPRVVILAGLENSADFKGIEGQLPEKVDTLRLVKSSLPDEDRLIYALTAK